MTGKRLSRLGAALARWWLEATDIAAPYGGGLVAPRAQRPRPVGVPTEPEAGDRDRDG